ncbi:MAG: prepilin-type N-terminal cleavage/methylation domain-containing protein [Sedimentisphaerales bacterium]
MKKCARAFTLMEVLVALAITAIGVIPLLHLLVISLSMMDSASCLSNASLIGNAKLAEMVSRGDPELGIESGVIDNENSNVIYQWQVNVIDAREENLMKLNLDGLKKISVCVLWNDGQRKKQVSMTTFICPDEKRIDTVSQDKRVSQ